MTTAQDPIAHAARLLREAAEELRQAHTYPRSEDWGRETDAKAAYDEHMAAAQALEDWEAAVGAGGVQALSAAPAGFVPVAAFDRLHAHAESLAARLLADTTHTLRASHGQASSQAGEYPALVCDYCGALTPDPWHSSGMLHGKMSKHIHSCDACAARGAAEAQAAKQQEQLI